MFNNLKLKTLTFLLVLILGGMGSILIYGMWSIQSRLLRVDDLWHQYQVDRSEKPRLQSSLCKAMGYGGMIHNFKDYVLRQNPHLINELNENFGAARATLARYDEISNSVEHAAIQDILSVLTKYQQALVLATSLVQKKTSIEKLNASIQVNDTIGLSALLKLQNEINTQESQQLKLADIHRKRLKSKAKLISNLRLAIGYGGMIHKFKNYVLHQNYEQIKTIDSDFKNAWDTINEYQKHKLNASEKHALENINQTVKNYHTNLNRIKSMIALKESSQKIDNTLRIDDSVAIQSLSILEKQISLQTAESSTEVNAILHNVNSSVNSIGGTILTLVVSLIIVFSWIMLKQIIRPINKLTLILTKLANDNLDIQIENIGNTHEIISMTKAAEILKKHALLRKTAEEELEKSNVELNNHINKIEKLRLNAQEQADNAMSLAENLSDARIAAELAQSQAEIQHNKIQIILDTVKDGIISADEHAKITSFNPAAETIFGYKSSEVIGESISILMPPKMRSSHAEYFNQFLQGANKRSPSMTVEQIGQHKNGHQFPIEISLNSMILNGQLNFTTVIRDITERKAAEEEIKILAMTDALTGLANRNQFQKRLAEAVHMADRHKEKFVLMMMDLDKFKPINDQHGHLIGDAVLVNVATKLNSVFRAIDTVARYGGDEFAVIVTALNETADAIPSIKRVLASLDDHIIIDGKTLDLGISIGVSVYPDDAMDTESIISHADKALYIAKEQSGNNYHFYDTTLTPIDNTQVS